jgi:hypothetical protein
MLSQESFDELLALLTDEGLRKALLRRRQALS